MPRAEAQRYPIFFAFGQDPRRLTTEEAITASPTERIGSVWPYIVKRVMKYHKSLGPMERINFDPEDICSEIVETLMVKDCKWDPERSSYITFAVKIATNAMSDLRNVARTVHSPRNSSCRMKNYEKRIKSGEITTAQTKTFEDIRRTLAAPDQFSVEDRRTENDPLSEARESERKTFMAKFLRHGSTALNVHEARVIGQFFGLNGQPSRSVSDIAATSGRTEFQVARDKAQALRKMRAAISLLPGAPRPELEECENARGHEF